MASNAKCYWQRETDRSDKNGEMKQKKNENVMEENAAPALTKTTRSIPRTPALAHTYIRSIIINKWKMENFAS